MIFKESFVEVSLLSDFNPERIDDILILLVENYFPIFDFDRLCPFSKNVIEAAD